MCPPKLRAPIAALYWFARTADDIADEGDAAPAQRLADLAQYREDLAAAVAGGDGSARWPQVFGPLRVALQSFHLPTALLADLLSAFEQDVAFSRDATRYASREELLDYCRRSANPVGRLLLHLYGVQDAQSLRMSDCICSALQLINFWQDLSVDIPRGRYYLPQDDCAAHSVAWSDLLARNQTPALTQLIAAEVGWARALMHEGAALVHRVPGRAGWELRLVVQGGLRILDKIAALNFTTMTQRPTLRAADAPLMLWRAAVMRPNPMGQSPS